ncbi:hypothetical protein ACTFIR_007958 [Dictyostelium discoideum]
MLNDDISTYKHNNCQFIEVNDILLYCKQCKVLLCQECILDHPHHKLSLLPTITHIEAPIPPTESKFNLFIKRKPAQNLEELHKLMENMVETKSIDSSIDLPLKDREIQFKEIENYLIEIANHYFLQCLTGSEIKKLKERANHYFLQCLTGSGIGKTRFGRECWNFLKNNQWNNNNKELAETMKNLMYIFIDFNGGGDAISIEEVKEDTCQVALAKRLFTRGVLGLSLARSNLNLYTEEKPLFTVKNVLHYISRLYSRDHGHGGKNTLSILIHVDEFPMAHEIACTHNQHFIKQMIELLGLYRCNGTDQSDASLSNVFITPILTGTTTILQQEIHLSQWTYKSITLTPLSYESCKEIIKHRFNIPKLKNKPTTTILEDKLFIIFIGDLGVIPRYLQWLLDLELMKNIEKDDIDIPSFISGLGRELIKRVQSVKIDNNKFWETILYLSICRVPVSWSTIVCDKTIEYWSYTGHLFLQYDEAVEGNVIFVPIFDLNKIAQKLKISLLEKLTKFPLIDYTKSTPFEENTAILILKKINTFVKSSNKPISKLVKFFPLDNDISHNAALIEVKICKVILYQHTSKWLYRSNVKLEITDLQKAIKFGSAKTEANTVYISSNNIKSVNLLASGNTSFDIRICFELPSDHIGKKYLMVVINTKFSSCGAYLGKEAIENIYENCINLEKHYKEAYILPILITNLKVNPSHVEDFKAKLIIYHFNNIHLFFGKLWHRVSFGAHDIGDFISPDLNLCKRIRKHFFIKYIFLL